MPERHYPAVSLKAKWIEQMTTSPQGAVTVGCDYNSSYVPNQDLVTYGPTGSITRQLDRTAQITGKANCIIRPVVDKNGDLYGKPDGGSTLLAYSGNTLKWQYQTGCATSSPPVVGGNGNIYFVDNNQHLIGLKPELAPGQTAPTKVLDIPVKGTCSSGNRLFAYVDGIVSTWNYGERIQYVSYGGKLLGEPPTSVPFASGDTPFDAQGRLFFPTYTGTGVNASIKVSVYDPRLGKVAWTTTVSEPGAEKRYPFFLHPTPGGGVIVTSEEQKVVNGTVPNSNEYITAVTELNVNGQKVGSMEFPNKDSAGNLVKASTYAVDMTGKLVVTRYWMVQRTSSPYQVPVTSIGVIDVDAEVVEYAEEMRGNFDSSQGPVYGYRLESQGTKAVIGPNTVYVNTNTCSDNCTTATDFKLHAVKVQGLGMDYPRGEVLNANTPAQPAPKKYVALGDSYSSGQGAGNYDPSTVVPNNNTCYRSANAYPQALNRDPHSPFQLEPNGFVACGGAETPVIENSWSGTNLDEDPQGQVLSNATELVTITIGGNDIGFGDVIKGCFAIVNCQSSVDDALADIGTLAPKLDAVYRHILTEAPNAEVYVLGYPPIVVEDENNLCLSTSQIGYPAILANKTKMRTVLDELNTTISTTVGNVHDDDPSIHYVDADEVDSPFSGHDVCAGEPFFNGLITQDTTESFHPSEKGQRAFADVMTQYMGN